MGVPVPPKTENSGGTSGPLLCNPPEEVFERLRGRVDREHGGGHRQLGFRLPEAAGAVAEYLEALSGAWREEDTEEVVRLLNFAEQMHDIARHVHREETEGG